MPRLTTYGTHSLSVSPSLAHSTAQYTTDIRDFINKRIVNPRDNQTWSCPLLNTKGIAVRSVSRCLQLQTPVTARLRSASITTGSGCLKMSYTCRWQVYLKAEFFLGWQEREDGSYPKVAGTWECQILAGGELSWRLAGCRWDPKTTQPIIVISPAVNQSETIETSNQSSLMASYLCLYREIEMRRDQIANWPEIHT